MPVKLSDYVFRRIAQEGVRHVFMVPGGGAMHMNDSLGHCQGLDFVCNLHEQAAAVAAEAYARVTNNLGVALVTSGPGGTNAVTGVLAAWLDSTPCLFLSGQVKRSDLKGNSGLRMLGNQEVDIVAIVSQITKYAVTITDPTTIRFHLEKAFHLARAPRGGPVWLDVPLDVQAAMIEPDNQPGYVPPPCTDPGERSMITHAVSRTLDMLLEAERPVVLAGNGVRLASGLADLHRFVERFQIPLLTTRLGADLVPYDHPLSFGMPGAVASRGANFTLQNSDFLLAIGSRLDMALTGYSHERFARGARKVMVDVDPAEIAKMGTRIDVPVCADAGLVLRELVRQGGQREASPRPDWIARCQEWKRRYPFELPEELRKPDAITTYDVATVLSDELDERDIVLPGSSGAVAEIFLTAFRTRANQRVFLNMGTGAMGFGQAAAIGACLASGGRRTVSMNGDGGFQMNIQELETIRRLALPIKLFVLNNDGYASIRSSQGTHFKRLTGADATSGLTLPDVVQVAQAYGLHACSVSDPADLTHVIRSVLASGGPEVCEIVIRRDEPCAPRIVSTQRPDGSMASKPLEDLWPFLSREEFRANMIIQPLEDA